ncbi:flagellar assembly protein FliH [Burkholderiaceae bacterium DAT-1]|nr:flagellar assembly protein FliH [Burkholderiaceae bacterium DAT-1]
MKAWGSKNILKGEESRQAERWNMGNFPGGSIQHPSHHEHSNVVRLDTGQVLQLEQPLPEVAPEVIPTHTVTTTAREPVPEVDEAELDAIRDTARNEGFAAGMEAGRKAGYDEGYAQGRDAGYKVGHAEGVEAGKEVGEKTGHDSAQSLVQQAVQHFETVIAGLDALTHDCERQLAPIMVDLALMAARQMVRATIQAQPEHLTQLIREALHEAGEQPGRVKVRLHPDDADVVSRMAEEEVSGGRWKIIPDGDIERGACRLDSPTMEQELDLESRWQRITSTLGSCVPWKQ